MSDKLKKQHTFTNPIFAKQFIKSKSTSIRNIQKRQINKQKNCNVLDWCTKTIKNN